MANYKQYYIEHGDVKFGFWAPPDAYPTSIRSELGVKEVTNTTKGVAYGINSPRPPRVRISTDKDKSFIRFCASKDLNDVTVNNKLKGKTLKGGKITTVSLPG